MREANQADSILLAAIHKKCFENFWSEHEFGSLLNNRAVFCSIYENAAFGLFQIAVDEMEVLTIAVLPESRRKGIAEKIMTNANEKADAIGVTKIFLDVAESNFAAISLYKKLGFAAINRRKEYYKKNTGYEDAIVMAKNISVSRPNAIQIEPQQ